MKDFGLKKLYYSISEVSKLTDLEQYILRYWETEFEQLKPSKNRAGNRIYTNKDIKMILLIKKLLREEKYTIEGAKKILGDPTELKNISENNSKNNGSSNQIIETQENRDIKKDLEELRNFLVDLRSKI
ncbi:MAG: MerR family transcriptional regulator [Ignavibacteriae bacterium]|nr:MerR family transcriptional regulator [Ignavibacteriota bacterium]MCB9209879.1 MerR family transcriptional regulator [Ignavibacteriales bacterium]MCB9260293.1 MerR family transcriptional regulator [Ignavibacteriales bacterium]